MENSELIAVHTFCFHHGIELSFVEKLYEFGLVNTLTIDDSLYLSPDELPNIEKMIRLHYELGINLEGIDVIHHLLNQLQELKQEVSRLRTELSINELS